MCVLVIYNTLYYMRLRTYFNFLIYSIFVTRMTMKTKMVSPLFSVAIAISPMYTAALFTISSVMTMQTKFNLIDCNYIAGVRQSIRTYTCSHIQTNIQIYILTYVHTYMHTHTCAYIRTYMCSYMHIDENTLIFPSYTNIFVLHISRRR